MRKWLFSHLYSIDLEGFLWLLSLLSSLFERLKFWTFGYAIYHRRSPFVVAFARRWHALVRCRGVRKRPRVCDVIGVDMRKVQKVREVWGDMIYLRKWLHGLTGNQEMALRPRNACLGMGYVYPTQYRGNRRYQRVFALVLCLAYVGRHKKLCHFYECALWVMCD